MKYLNKIVFINSASINYAEISVDGNVHFTGTQGVGKSTILRALLFFYNGDKQKLGIQILHGQKSFDEFYFRQSNSYILYEVVHDAEVYTILLSRYQGRVTWRFIDAPYQKEWLVEPEGQVLSDWVKIRERIDKNIVVTARIDSGSVYRDIIFGNTHDHRYLRYSLVQSVHYQNIPRSIQNVFLNTKLDADFVKNTIIQSMSEDELKVDLQTYRRQVSEFEREYDEIDCWFRQAKDGTVPVRQQAQKIAEQGRIIVALDQQLFEVWHALNYAVAQCEKNIPLLQTSLEDMNIKIETEKKRASEWTTDYNSQKDSLNQQLGEKNGKLKEIAQKRKYFEESDIQSKLRLAEREPALKQECEEKLNLRDGLLQAHATIEEKYNIARGKLENAVRAFELSQTEALNRKRNELQIKRNQLEEEKNKNKKQVSESYKNWQHESNERLQLLIEEQHQAGASLKELKQWHPKADEMKLVSDDLHQLEVQSKENAAQLIAVNSQIVQVQHEFDMQSAALKSSCEKKREDLENQKTQRKESIGKLDSLLAHLQDSFYEWLTQHIEGWEDTIGRVVDEERILYMQGLEPRLDNTATGLFGVSLNLDNVPLTHRSPDELRREKKTLEAEVQDIIRQLDQLSIDLDSDIAKLTKKFTEKLNPLRQEHTRLVVEAEQIPIKQQNLQNRLHALQMVEQDLVEAERQVRQKAYDNAILNVTNENDARKKRESKNEKELTEIETTCQNELNKLRDILQNFKTEQITEAEIRNQEFTDQYTELDRQQKAELAGQGVDVQLLEQFRNAVNQLEEQLRQIELERPLVTEYNVAERDMFAKEPTIQKEKKAIELSLQSLRQKYEDKRHRIEKKIDDLQSHAQSLQEQLSHMQTGLEQYRQVVEKEHLVPVIFLSDSKSVTSRQDCQELVTQMRGTINQKRETIETLKQTVVVFNRNFNPQNAFHFNTMPATDDDYLQIAADLQDFLDNNKIEEFRRRTSEHYKDILGRISSEIGSLMKRRSDVDAVIQEINRDFVEKNFAGVIRSIELQAGTSSDKLMQLLMSIQKYTEENALSIGELNLFSEANHDEVNRQVVNYLKSMTHLLQDESARTSVSLADTFRLQFRVRENDNDTGWVEHIYNVGSDGTDILVKAMVNIMLINVFKKKAANKNGDFIVHCMMDEIGRLHPNNIKGILQFANSRNIYLINSSPTSYNPYDYKYTYLLTKHNLKTRVEKLLKRNL